MPELFGLSAAANTVLQHWGVCLYVSACVCERERERERETERERDAAMNLRVYVTYTYIYIYIYIHTHTRIHTHCVAGRPVCLHLGMYVQSNVYMQIPSFVILCFGVSVM